MPLDLSDEEIVALLQDQNVTEAFRFSIRSGLERTPSKTVAIIFSESLPEKVKLNLLIHYVSKYYPNPIRCTKCWRLGHTKSVCHSSWTTCKTCGKQEHGNVNCTPCCVNCKSDKHESDSGACPAYSTMKEAIKISVDEGIPIKVAKQRLSTPCCLIRQQSEINKAEMVSRFDGSEMLIRSLVPPVYAHLPLPPQLNVQEQVPEPMDSTSTLIRPRQEETKDDGPPRKVKTATSRIPSRVDK